MRSPATLFHLRNRDLGEIEARAAAPRFNMEISQQSIKICSGAAGGPKGTKPRNLANAWRRRTFLEIVSACFCFGVVSGRYHN
jgi:hypothetical protein